MTQVEEEQVELEIQQSDYARAKSDTVEEPKSEENKSEEPMQEPPSKTTKETNNNGTIDKKLLGQILKETQCPLTPDKYGKASDLSSAYYFDGEFYKFNDDGSLEMIDFNGDEKKKRKAMDDSELILAVDKYVSYVHINNSIEVFGKLKTALAETQGDDDGDDTNDAYQKLIPTMTGLII